MQKTANTFITNEQAIFGQCYPMQKDSILTNAAILKKGGAAEIVAYIYLHNNKGTLNLSNLIDNLDTTSRTIRSTLAYLTAHGITMEKKEKKFPFEHKLWLTERGLVFGKHLVDALASLQTSKAQQKASKP